MDVDVRRLLVRTGSVLGWVVLPAVLLVWAVVHIAQGAGIDFDANVWQPAKAVLDGRSPYPPPQIEALVRPSFLYPPLLLGLDIPLSVLPHDIARGVFWVLEAVVVLAALRLAGVEDRRVLVWGSLSFPVFYSESLGNPTILLMLPLAVAWRWRDRPWVAGVAVGLAGALKLIVWPLGVWLLVTRRWRAAVIAAGAAALGVAVPWLAIGFDGFRDYPHVASLYAEHNGRPRAMTVATLVHRAGLSWSAGHVAQWVCGITLLVLAAVVARRVDGDRRAFSLAVVAALVLSPIVWVQYTALLLIPLAVARPTFTWEWQVVRASWLFLLLPRGQAMVVAVDGRLLKTAGYVPTLWRLLAVLAFIAAIAWITGSAPGAPAGAARRRHRDRSTDAVRQAGPAAPPRSAGAR